MTNHTVPEAIARDGGRGARVQPTPAHELIARRLLDQEARALLTRLMRVEPFVLSETMVMAAAVSNAAQAAIEGYLAQGRRNLRQATADYIRWLRSAEGQRAALPEAQRRFTLLRLRFNIVLSQFDIFADVLTQRSEHGTGVWMAGLDAVAADALSILGGYFEAPPVVCYLDRGHGAAIRRARTRLPGGGENPVAVVRVPRERMVSSSVASSLVHEVGHQGAAQLDLVNSMRLVMQGLQRAGGEQRRVWQLWERWLSEIIPDFWSVARVGVASTLGLMGVVSLPRAFVFRLNADDPHPIPWTRVMVSCALGDALYPHPQWAMLSDMWASLYPLSGLDGERQKLLVQMNASIPGFVSLLVNHRPRSLRGKSLAEVMATADRRPADLRACFEAWRIAPEAMRDAPPSLVFAAFGQARADGRLSPEQESRFLSSLLRYWAMRRTIDAAASCAAVLETRALARAA